jgi:phenylpyruvate tautomerase PptA (4-oxalocrotonate tautomerase family)
VTSSAIAVEEARREQKSRQFTYDQKAAIYKSVAGLLFDVTGRHRKVTRVIFHDPESRNMGQGRTDATRLPSVKK